MIYNQDDLRGETAFKRLALNASAEKRLYQLMEEYSDHSPADVAWYPMVPIRDVVIFPFTKAVAFKIGRSGSVRALEQALAADRTNLPRYPARRHRR